MAMLRPKLAILDETDSGLDIDALRIVADGVNALRGPEFSALVITHHQRLLDHLVPDRVHVLSQGRIIRSGGPELARELEANGYAGKWWRTRHEPVDPQTVPTPSSSRYQGLRDRLPGDAAMRDAAAAAFKAGGLPVSMRDEDWRYTSLRALAETDFQEPLTEVSTAPILGEAMRRAAPGADRRALSARPVHAARGRHGHRHLRRESRDFGRLPASDLPMVGAEHDAGGGRRCICMWPPGWTRGRWCYCR